MQVRIPPRPCATVLLQEQKLLTGCASLRAPNSKSYCCSRAALSLLTTVELELWNNL